MTDKNLLIIGIMAVCLIGAVAYIGLNEWENATQTAYWDGFNDGTNLTIQQINSNIVNSLSTNGFVPFTVNDGNQTFVLKLGVVQ